MGRDKQRRRDVTRRKLTAALGGTHVSKMTRMGQPVVVVTTSEGSSVKTEVFECDEWPYPDQDPPDPL